MPRAHLGLVFATLAVWLASCGPAETSSPPRPRSLPFLTGMESRLAAIGGQDGAWLRDYLAGGGALSEEYNERQLSQVLGRMMHEDSSEELAVFVDRAKDRLYEEFFHPFSDVERLALAAALRQRCHDGSVLAEKYAAVLGARAGVFPATLALMLRSLPLAEIARPSRMTASRVVGLARGSGGDPSILAGGAEVLASDLWVAREDGGRDERQAVAAARELLTEAVDAEKDDPVLRVAYVLLHFRADITRSELQRICEGAAEAEPDNGAYPYLTALTLAESGRDREAAERVREGMAKPYVTFYEVERARHVAAFLRGAGLGPLGARLASYEGASVEGPMLMGTLGQLLRQNPTAVDGRSPLVVAFPRRLSAQMALRPRLLSSELIRLQLLLGSWEWTVGQSPDSDEARAVRDEKEALEAGMKLASGSEAWDELFVALGEKKFLIYVENVLLGNEAEFLKRCAGLGSLEACSKLLP